MIVSKSPSTGGVVVWSYGSFGVSFELSKIVVSTFVLSPFISPIFTFSNCPWSSTFVISKLNFSPLSAKESSIVSTSNLSDEFSPALIVIFIVSLSLYWVSPSWVVLFVYFIVTSVSFVTVTGFPSLSTNFTTYWAVSPSFTVVVPSIIAKTISSLPYPPSSPPGFKGFELSKIVVSTFVLFPATSPVLISNSVELFPVIDTL